MTKHQEQLLRIIGDPDDKLCRLYPADKTAIRAALDDRAELLAACEEALEHVRFEVEESGPIKGRLMAAIAKAIGGQP